MKWLTVARDLKRRKARERNGLFVAEGVRAVEELARSPLAVEAVLCAEAALQHERAAAVVNALGERGVPVLTLSDADFNSAADTEHPQGILAIAKQPRHVLGELDPGDHTRLLVLDAIQDPGNVGVLARTTAALSATAVIALPGTVDLWNAKVVRSAVGTHFRFPALEATLEELTAYLAHHTIPLWGTDAGGVDLTTMTAPRRLALAVGNEGAGLTPALRAGCSTVVSLPMSPDVESFNVAVAAGITLFALRP